MNSLTKDEAAFLRTIYRKDKKSRRSAFAKLKHFRRLANTHPPDVTLWKRFYEEPQGKYIREKLRDFLASKQNERCAYCGEKFFGFGGIHIDHVMPRKHYPCFSFEFKNLVLACIDCNYLKTANDWFQLPSLIYPITPGNLQCYHPNYHDINNHIKVFVLRTNHLSLRTYVGTSTAGKKLCSELLDKICLYELRTQALPNLPGAVRKLTKFLALKANGKRSDVESFVKMLSQWT